MPAVFMYLSTVACCHAPSASNTGVHMYSLFTCWKLTHAHSHSGPSTLTAGHFAIRSNLHSPTAPRWRDKQLQSFFHWAVVRCCYTPPCSPCWSWVDYENISRKKEKKILHVLPLSPPPPPSKKQNKNIQQHKTPTQTTTVKHGVSAPEQRTALFKSDQ